MVLQPNLQGPSQTDLYCNEYKCYRTPADVREVLPSSATEYKHSHVIVRGFDTPCVFLEYLLVLVV